MPLPLIVRHRLQKNRHTYQTMSMCLRCLSAHFWLIHFRKRSNPPPRLLSLIEEFERRTVPPAMEQPTKRKAITLSKIRFILPLFITTLLSFFKTYIFIISKTPQFTKRFRKIFKKIFPTAIGWVRCFGFSRVFLTKEIIF